MLKIRLKRIGRKKVPFYRIIVIESLSRRDGRPIEQVGYFDPNANNIKINKMKFAYWLNQGAQPTDRVRSIIKKIL